MRTAISSSGEEYPERGNRRISDLNLVSENISARLDFSKDGIQSIWMAFKETISYEIDNRIATFYPKPTGKA